MLSIAVEDCLLSEKVQTFIMYKTDNFLGHALNNLNETFLNNLVIMKKRLLTPLAFALCIVAFQTIHAQTWSSGSGGDIYYNGGQVGIGVSSPVANLQVKVGAFSAVQNNYTGDVHVYTADTAGLNNYGGAVSFSRIAGSGKRAAIAAKQTGGDEDEMGLAFFTHGGTYTADLVESVLITHSGYLKLNTTGAQFIFSNSGNDWVNYVSGTNGIFYNISRASTGGNEFFVYSDDDDYTKAYIKIGGTTTISNSGTSTFNNGFNVLSGNVGIGTTNTHGYKLAVSGGVLAEKIYLEQETNWPDYVFSSKYHLRSLEETESYINENSHLPNMPSAAEVEENGYDLGTMNAKLLEKIEELTLHLINEHKRIDQIIDENTSIKEANAMLQRRIEALESGQN